MHFNVGCQKFTTSKLFRPFSYNAQQSPRNMLDRECELLFAKRKYIRMKIINSIPVAYEEGLTDSYTFRDHKEFRIL